MKKKAVAYQPMLPEERIARGSVWMRRGASAVIPSNYVHVLEVSAAGRVKYRPLVAHPVAVARTLTATSTHFLTTFVPSKRPNTPESRLRYAVRLDGEYERPNAAGEYAKWWGSPSKARSIAKKLTAESLLGFRYRAAAAPEGRLWGIRVFAWLHDAILPGGKFRIWTGTREEAEERTKPSPSRELIGAEPLRRTAHVYKGSGVEGPRSTVRRRHSRSGVIRCDLCAPARCSKAK